MPHHRTAPPPLHSYAAGLHLVTLHTKSQHPLFGRMVDGTMQLSMAGEIAREEWLWTPIVRESVASDAFVVMPNQVRLLLRVEPGLDGGEAASTETVDTIVEHYRSTVTMRICATLGHEACCVWRDGYEDHIVRSPSEAEAIRRSFRETPARRERVLLAA